MIYSKISKVIMLIVTLSLVGYFLHIFVFSDYMDRSAISDQPSILIKVWDDNALSIGGVKFDDSKETTNLRQQTINPDNKWFLKGKRKLTTRELNCLNYGFFSTAMINGYVDIICDNNGEIIYIN